MSYEFVSMEDAGTHTGDFIIKLRWKPSQLRRWFGAQEDVVAYYGQDARWHAMDGLPASARVRVVLERLWQKEQQGADADRKSSKFAVRTTSQFEPACCDVVELASEGSFPASDPPAWTLGR